MKRSGYFVFVGLLSWCAVASLGGCSHLLLLNPKGPIGDAERFVIIAAFALMLIMRWFQSLLWFSGLRGSTGHPIPKRSILQNGVVPPRLIRSSGWFPLPLLWPLGILAWSETYSLDPYKPIDTCAKPINIEAVSLDWNWLFIYPDYNIAVVNQLVFPSMFLSTSRSPRTP